MLAKNRTEAELQEPQAISISFENTPWLKMAVVGFAVAGHIFVYKIEDTPQAIKQAKVQITQHAADNLFSWNTAVDVMRLIDSTMGV